MNSSDPDRRAESEQTAGPPSPLSRREFVHATLLGIPASVLPFAPSTFASPETSLETGVGPVLGHIDEHRICCFIRAPREGEVTLIVTDGASKEIARLKSSASEKNDLCVQFEISRLTPNSEYTGAFFDTEERPLFEGARFHTRTPAVPNDVDKVVLGMGSCVSSTKFDEIWRQVQAQKVEAFCLLGDSPYIDTTQLEKNRSARRTFWNSLPTLRTLSRSIPFWLTWDDHDFGKNDSDGLIPDKENIRKAFLEYSALANYGEDDEGIYTRFRRGPVEVWLIDDRWFSQTDQSWADPKQKTCLGRRQWKWLQQSLKSSTASFKILCTGMVWYPKGNREKDHWETYCAEREAIFSFIRDEGISGVILVSGDIHVCRHHRYDDRLGYPLHECVVSPMHERVIPSLDVEHPARIWSKPEPNVFLKIEAERDSLTATWLSMAGKTLHAFTASTRELGKEPSR